MIAMTIFIHAVSMSAGGSIPRQPALAGADSDFPHDKPRYAPTVRPRHDGQAGSVSAGCATMNTMIDLDKLDELARRLSSLVPPGLREGREELQQNFKSVLQTGLAKLDLVTREEFEVQRAVLLRTREKLEELQRAVAELEAQLGTSAPPPRH